MFLFINTVTFLSFFLLLLSSIQELQIGLGLIVQLWHFYAVGRYFNVKHYLVLSLDCQFWCRKIAKIIHPVTQPFNRCWKELMKRSCILEWNMKCLFSKPFLIKLRVFYFDSISFINARHTIVNMVVHIKIDNRNDNAQNGNKNQYWHDEWHNPIATDPLSRGPRSPGRYCVFNMNLCCLSLFFFILIQSFIAIRWSHRNFQFKISCLQGWWDGKEGVMEL